MGMIKAYLSLIDRLKEAGIKPKHQVYALLEQAEKAIQMFRDHLIAILSEVYSSFPIHLWDQLIPQTEMPAVPKISTYAYLNRLHNYNRILLVLLGCEVQVHERTKTKTVLYPHSCNG
ncbi:hypothetical protein ACHAW6_005992 [Cyclotella cf. meneghiniana]